MKSSISRIKQSCAKDSADLPSARSGFVLSDMLILPNLQMTPIRGGHILPPAVIEAASVLLTRQGLLHYVPRDCVVRAAGGEARFVVERKFARDGTAGCFGRVTPVLHVVLLCHSCRTRI